MPSLSKRHKVDRALKQRWGIVGTVLGIAFFIWYVQTSGNQRNADKQLQNENLVKIVCPRCNGAPDKIKTCSLCQGYGYIWVDKTRQDLPPEIQKKVEDAVRQLEE